MPVGDPVISVTAPPLQVEGLSKSYGTNEVLRDVHLTVRPGRVVGLFGSNGSGKTTLIRAALGLLRAGGSSRFFGKRYSDLGCPGAEVGVTFTTPRFHPSRSARDELRLAATGCETTARDPDQLLAQVGLSAVAGERVETFSRGMAQRLALARALVGDPPLLILDEPSEGLDLEGTRLLRDLLLVHAKGGGSVLVASHVLDEMARIVDDVVVLDQGRVARQGALDDLCPPRRTVRVRAGEAGALEQALAEEGIGCRREDHGVDVPGVDAATVGRAAAARGIAIEELVEVEAARDERLRAVLDGVAEAREA